MKVISLGKMLTKFDHSSENEIRLLNINSIGGYISASYYLADLVIDYDLDTNVSGSCSACTTVFWVAINGPLMRILLVFTKAIGEQRQLKIITIKEKRRVGKLRLNSHRGYIRIRRMKLTDLEYLIERGVSAAFFKTLQASSDDMWYQDEKN